MALHSRSGERRLYFVLGGGRALRYVIGVGRAGKQWTGAVYIEGEFIQPSRAPPAEIRRDRPNLPAVIASAAASVAGCCAGDLAGSYTGIDSLVEAGKLNFHERSIP